MNTPPLRSRALCASLLLLALSLYSATAVAQPVDLQEGDLELLGSPLGLFYTPEEVVQKRGFGDMEIYQNEVHFSHGGTHNNIPHRFLYYDIASQSFEQALKQGGEPFTTQEETTRIARVLSDGLYFAGYDPFGGSRTKHVRRNPDGTWEVLEVTKKDSHSRDIFEFEGRLFSIAGGAEVVWPKVAYSADRGATWQFFEDPDRATGYKPSIAFEFFSFQGTLYASSPNNEYRRDEQGNLSGPFVSDEPYMIAYDGGEGEVTFRTAFEDALDFVPDARAAGEVFSPYVSQAVELRGKLLFFFGTERMLTATSIEPPQVSEVALRPGTRLYTLKVFGQTAWRLSGLVEDNQTTQWFIDVSHDGDTWEPIVTIDPALAVFNPADGEITPSLSHLVVDDQGDIYLGGSGVTLFRISSALYTLPPNPFDPQGGEEMGGQDMGDDQDMGSTGDLDLGGELDAGSDLGSNQKDAGPSSPPDDMSAAKQDMSAEPSAGEPMTRPEAMSEGCCMVAASSSRSRGHGAMLLGLALGGLVFVGRRRRDHRVD